MISSIVLNIVLFIVVIILTLDNISIKKEIKNINNFLDNIDNDRTRVKLQVNLKYEYIEELAYKINKVIKTREQIIISRKNQEDKLKAFIASVSHDLRTPLTSIKGYVQLLEKENITNTQKENYITVVKRKINVLNKLINDFFLMSLYDSDEYELSLEKINLTKLVTEVLIENYSNFKSKNIEPIISIKEEDIYIIGDKVASERILNNLISNAIKYTTNNVSIELGNTGKECFVKISNEHNGISDEDVDKMFDRFYRVDKSRNSEGSGIGLYVVKTLVKKLGWKSLIKKEENLLSVNIIIPIFNG